MKNTILILISLLFLVSCASDEPKSRNNPFGETTETISIEPDSVVTKEIQYKYIPAVIEDDGIASYWFVMISDSKGTKWSDVQKQEHSYVSLKEIKQSFVNDKDYNPSGDKKAFVFILDFIQVSEATYIDYTNK